MSDETSYCVAIKPLDFFRSSEHVNVADVHKLAASIADTGVWTTPIPVDTETGIIMDGNHRARAAALLRLRYVPCVLLSYDDARVSVTHWRTGEPFRVDRIVEPILGAGQVLPYKTTRHRFAPALPRTAIDLTVLR